MQSKDKWNEIIIETPYEYEDLIYSILYDNNILTYEIIDHKTEEDVKKTKPYWVELEGEIIPESDNIFIKIYLSEDEFSKDDIIKLSNILHNLSNDIILNIGDSIEDTDWSKEWKKYYKPFKIGKNIIIKPSWEEYIPHDGEVIIEIDPGMAFGTGTHETTSLCVEAIQKLDLNGKTVCDVGCGSGILAITAAKLGAKSITAIDIDQLSVDATNVNSKLNGTEDIINTFKGDLLNNSSMDFDVIFANILPDVIVKLIPAVTKSIKPNGIFLTSGIIKEKKEYVVESLKKYNFQIEEIVEKGEWISILSKYNNA